MKVVVIANTAGGVGKTTTSHAVAVAAVEYGKKVLVIDADPAATLTFCCGIENPRITTSEFLSGEYSLAATVVKTSERFSLIPSATRLYDCNLDSALKTEAFQRALAEFDLVIVDTGSGPSRLLTYFLELADLVLSPARPEIIAIRGALHIRDFAASFEIAKKIYLLLSNESQVIAGEIMEQLRSDFAILEPVIRRNPLVSQVQLIGRSVVTAYKENEVSADFREATYSILEELSLI